MKLSDYKGAEALNVLADLIEPVGEIVSDKEILDILRKKGSNKLSAVSLAIRNHTKSVIAILAALERKTPEEYENEVTLYTLPKALLDVLNDPELAQLFTSRGQTGDAISFGSASAKTE